MSAPRDSDLPGSKQARLQRALSRIPLFAALSERASSALLACARLVDVAAGELVIERGEPAHALFGVAQGKLKVVAPRPGGRDATLHILGPGDVFGEVALFQDKGRTARVSALETAQLLVIDRRDFIQLVERDATLATRLLTLMARRVHDTIAHFDATTSLDVTKRLARKLLSLGELFGTRDAHGHRALMLSLSQSELAELIDSSRQTVNRLLREWTARGWLETRDGRLVLLDEAALTRVSDGEGEP